MINPFSLAGSPRRKTYGIPWYLSMSAEETHELFELLTMKKKLDGYRLGPEFVTLDEYIDRRIVELRSSEQR